MVAKHFSVLPIAVLSMTALSAAFGNLSVQNGTIDDLWNASNGTTPLSPQSQVDAVLGTEWRANYTQLGTGLLGIPYTPDSTAAIVLDSRGDQAGNGGEVMTYLGTADGAGTVSISFHVTSRTDVSAANYWVRAHTGTDGNFNGLSQVAQLYNPVPGLTSYSEGVLSFQVQAGEHIYFSAQANYAGAATYQILLQDISVVNQPSATPTGGIGIRGGDIAQSQQNGNARQLALGNAGHGGAFATPSDPGGGLDEERAYADFGNVTAWEAVQTGLADWGTSTPHFFDVNGDGLDDFISVDYPGGARRLLTALNNGDNTFGTNSGTPPAIVTLTGWDGNIWQMGDTTSKAHFGDFNGDGLIDFLEQRNQGNNVNQFNVALGNGDGTFGTHSGGSRTAWDFSLNNAGYYDDLLLVGDVDGDGKDDIVCIDSKHILRVATSNGDGSFGIWQGSTSPATFIAWSKSITSYGNTEPKFLADVNGDGLADIIDSQINNIDWTYTLNVALNRGDLTFGVNNGSNLTAWDAIISGIGDSETELIWGVNRSRDILELVDANGDGFADIVARGWDEDSNENLIRVAYNDGTGLSFGETETGTPLGKWDSAQSVGNFSHELLFGNVAAVVDLPDITWDGGNGNHQLTRNANWNPDTSATNPNFDVTAYDVIIDNNTNFTSGTNLTINTSSTTKDQFMFTNLELSVYANMFGNTSGSNDDIYDHFGGTFTIKGTAAGSNVDNAVYRVREYCIIDNQTSGLFSFIGVNNLGGLTAPYDRLELKGGSFSIDENRTLSANLDEIMLTLNTGESLTYTASGAINTETITIKEGEFFQNNGLSNTIGDYTRFRLGKDAILSFGVGTSDVVGNLEVNAAATLNIGANNLVFQKATGVGTLNVINYTPGTSSLVIEDVRGYVPGFDALDAGEHVITSKITINGSNAYVTRLGYGRAVVSNAPLSGSSGTEVDLLSAAHTEYGNTSLVTDGAGGSIDITANASNAVNGQTTNASYGDDAFQIDMRIDPNTDPGGSNSFRAGFSFDLATDSSNPEHAEAVDKVSVTLVESQTIKQSPERPYVERWGEFVVFVDQVQESHATHGNYVVEPGAFQYYFQLKDNHHYHVRMIGHPHGAGTRLRLYLEDMMRPVMEFDIGRAITARHISAYADSIGAAGGTANVQSLSYTPLSLADAMKDYLPKEYVLGNLNLDFPGLGAVKTAYLAGDLDLAQTEFVNYFRNRSVPVGPPLEVADYGNNFLAEANAALEGKYDADGAQTTFVSLVNEDGTIKWDRDTGKLCRHFHWTALAKAYADTANSAYVSRLAFEIKDYVSRDPFFWTANPNVFDLDYLDGTVLKRGWLQTSNIGRRTELTWWDAFEATKANGSMDEDAFMHFLTGIIRQARLIMNPSTFAPWDDGGGHVAAAMVQNGVMFPECLSASEWRSRGDEMIQIINDTQVYADGSHASLSSGYAGAYHETMSVYFDILERTGETIPQFALTAYENFQNWWMTIARPNQELVDLNDGGTDEVWEVFERPFSMFPSRGEFEWFYSQELSGTPPSWNSNYLPQAGLFSMRSGWGSNVGELYGLMDAGPFGASHGKANRLHIYIDVINSADGDKVMLSNGGRGDYTTNDYNSYASSTRGWNVIRVREDTGGDQSGEDYNDQQAGDVYPGDPVESRRWHSDDFIDFAEGTHTAGWSGVSGTHSRQFIFIKNGDAKNKGYFLAYDAISPGNSSQSYDYELPFHLNIDGGDMAPGEPLVYEGEDPNGGMRIIPLDTRDGLSMSNLIGQTDPYIQGWFVVAGGQGAMNTPNYRWTATGDMMKAWLFLPEGPSPSWNITGQTIVSQSSTQNITELDRLDGGKDYLAKRASSGSAINLGGVNVTGDFAFVSENPDGNIVYVYDTDVGANHAPVPLGSTHYMSEHAAVNDSLTTIAANDPNVGDSHTFAITGGNVGNAWDIDPDSGEITVNKALSAGSRYDLTVSVTDNASRVLSGTATITIHVQTALENFARQYHGQNGFDADNPAHASIDSDFDGDGLALGLEYIMGLPPTTPDSADFMPQAYRTGSAFCVMFKRLEPMPAGIRLTYLGANDLSDPFLPLDESTHYTLNISAPDADARVEQEMLLDPATPLGGDYYIRLRLENLD